MGLLKRTQEKAGRAKLSGQGKKPQGKAKARPTAGQAIAIQDPEGIKPLSTGDIAKSAAADQVKAKALPSTAEDVIRPAVVGKVETKPGPAKEKLKANVGKETEATWIKILEVVAGVLVVGAVMALPAIVEKLKRQDEYN
jgi:hypothetical protein